jgi:hypothetical protein
VRAVLRYCERRKTYRYGVTCMDGTFARQSGDKRRRDSVSKKKKGSDFEARRVCV